MSEEERKQFTPKLLVYADEVCISLKHNEGAGAAPSPEQCWPIMRSFQIGFEQTMTIKWLQTSCAAQSSDSKVQYLPHYLEDFSDSQCFNGHAAVERGSRYLHALFNHSPPLFGAINTTYVVRHETHCDERRSVCIYLLFATMKEMMPPAVWAGLLL